MVTLTPSSKVKVRFVTPDSNSEHLSAALRPWHRRLALQQTLTWTGRGIIAGLILACLLLLSSRLIPWAPAPYWAIGLPIACLRFAFDPSTLIPPSRPIL